MKTYFGLMAQYERGEIPLSAVAADYLNLSPEVADKRASMNLLPFPTYRVGSNKSPRMVSAEELAKYIDKQKQTAQAEWEKSQLSATTVTQADKAA